MKGINWFKVSSPEKFAFVGLFIKIWNVDVIFSMFIFANESKKVNFRNNVS